MPRPRRSKGRDKKKKEQENVVDGGQPAGVDPSQSTYQAPQSYDQSIDQSGLDAKMEDWKQQVRPEIDQGFGTVNEELQSYFKSVESTLDDPPFESAEGRYFAMTTKVSRVLLLTHTMECCRPAHVCR